MLWRLWLLVWSEGPTNQGTMSPIELLWTAKNVILPTARLWYPDCDALYYTPFVINTHFLFSLIHDNEENDDNVCVCLWMSVCVFVCKCMCACMFARVCVFISKWPKRRSWREADLVCWWTLSLRCNATMYTLHVYYTLQSSYVAILPSFISILYLQSSYILYFCTVASEPLHSGHPPVAAACEWSLWWNVWPSSNKTESNKITLHRDILVLVFAVLEMLNCCSFTFPSPVSEWALNSSLNLMCTVKCAQLWMCGCVHSHW